MASIVILSGLIPHMNKAAQDRRALFHQIWPVDVHIFSEKMRQTIFSKRILFYLSSEHTKLSLKATKCITGMVSKIFQLWSQFFRLLIIVIYTEIRELLFNLWTTALILNSTAAQSTLLFSQTLWMCFHGQFPSLLKKLWVFSSTWWTKLQGTQTQRTS